MRIQGLGVIDDAVLELGPGLTVVTGETGAGKTMVVQGLSLLFGGRADVGRLRPGAARAVVEGRLLLDPGHPTVSRAQEAGGELDDGALLVVRTVGSDGRSRAFVGGRSVPVGVLGEMGEQVLALHGQSDQQRLLSGSRQREALDRYAGPAVLDRVARFRTGWSRLREVRQLVQQLTDEAAEREREAELLRAGLAEVEALAAQPGEDLALAAEVERLANSDDLRLAATTAQAALTGHEDSGGPEADAVGLLTAARRALELGAEHDARLAELSSRVQDVAIVAADLAQDLASYADGVDTDPARLASAQARLAALTTVSRRHGATSIDEVLSWASAASDRLLALDGAEDAIAALRSEQERLSEQLGQLAAELHDARTEAASRFGEAVTLELVELAMPHAGVSAAVTTRPDVDGLCVSGTNLAAGPEGVDEVELLLVPHPGAPARALHKGASGGELSRVMLAVEVVFAGTDPMPLMVFDEVDAGVGGKAAVEVGRRLARLARDHQVVVVTHLPQVAAFADRHLMVEKASDGPEAGSVTRSGIVTLEGEARVAELSRMLAGLDSGLARAHAEELLAAASLAKSG